MTPRNAKSLRLRQQALDLVVGGGQAHKRPFDLEGGSPAFIARASGARFWDVDGHEYIDYLLGYGPIVLGHGWPTVEQAVREQMGRGIVFDAEHPAQVELARQLVRLIPSAEKVAYFVGGSGATTGAVRIARAHTGRDLVVRCGYHGWHDWCQPDTRGVPASVGALTLTVPYNDLEALETTFKQHSGQVAAVIIESVQGEGPAQGYFDGVRELTRAQGVIFILDEVKTGFRFALGGAQAYFGIHPDLSVFGKAMCNGYPGAVVVGQREVMDAAETTWLAATFHADPLSCVAALATIHELERADGIGHQWRLGGMLKEGLIRLFSAAGVPLSVRGYPVLAQVVATEEHGQALQRKFLSHLINHGSFINAHPWFLSLSHTERDIARTLEQAETALQEAMEEIKER